VDISLLSLWFVCALGSAIFGALASPAASSAMAFILSFVAAALWTWHPLAAPPVTASLFAVLFAGVSLVRGARPLYAAAAAGLLAGFWTDALRAQGLPSVAAVVVAPSIALLSAWLSVSRRGFATELLREEALIFALVLGVVAAAAPSVTEGWRAATNLNVQAQDTQGTAATAIPVWTIALASTALLSGGAYSLWSRR
jgi:hypothetical protein